MGICEKAIRHRKLTQPVMFSFPPSFVILRRFADDVPTSISTTSHCTFRNMPFGNTINT
jgi:hypothetical protein